MSAHKSCDPPSIEELKRRLEENPESCLSICLEFALDSLTAYEVNDFWKKTKVDGKALQTKEVRKKAYKTLAGPIELESPQFKHHRFIPTATICAEKAEEHLKTVVAKLYWAGDSDRDLAEILTEEVCAVSRSWVSRISQEEQSKIASFLERDLNYQNYLCLTPDSMYINVRIPDKPKDRYKKIALSYALGLNTTGHWEVLGAILLFSETTLGYQILFEDLQRRHIGEVLLVTSDFHRSFAVAIPTCFPESERQGCTFHSEKGSFEAFTKELGDRFNRKKNDSEGRLRDRIIITELFRIFYKDTPNFLTSKMIAKPLLDGLGFSEKTQKKLLNHYAETLAFLHFPKALWPSISNSNQIERSNEEIRERTKVLRGEPNSDALIRLASEILLKEEKRWNCLFPKGTAESRMTAIIEHEKLAQEAFNMAKAGCEKFPIYSKLPLTRHEFKTLWCNCFTIRLLLESRDRDISISFLSVHGVSGSETPTLLLLTPINFHCEEAFRQAAMNLIDRGIDPKKIKLIANSTFFTEDYKGFTDCFEKSHLYQDPSFFQERFLTLIPEAYQETFIQEFRQMFSPDSSKGARARLNTFKKFLIREKLENGQNYLSQIELELKADLETLLLMKNDFKFKLFNFQLPQHWKYKIKVLENDPLTPDEAIEALVASLKRKSTESSASDK